MKWILSAKVKRFTHVPEKTEGLGQSHIQHPNALSEQLIQMFSEVLQKKKEQKQKIEDVIDFCEVKNESQRLRKVASDFMRFK